MKNRQKVLLGFSFLLCLTCQKVTEVILSSNRTAIFNKVVLYCWGPGSSVESVEGRTLKVEVQSSKPSSDTCRCDRISPNSRRDARSGITKTLILTNNTRFWITKILELTFQIALIAYKSSWYSQLRNNSTKTITTNEITNYKNDLYSLYRSNVRRKERKKTRDWPR